MSKKNLVAFLQFAVKDRQLATRLRNPVAYEDFKAIAAEYGYDVGRLTAVEIRRTVEILKGSQNEIASTDDLHLPAARDSRAGTVGEIHLSFSDIAAWSFCESWPSK